VEWVVREGVGAGEEMTQALYAHMNNKKYIYLKKKKKKEGREG
jgi:NaMN:DMB phosphoribosyltransferase